MIFGDLGGPGAHFGGPGTHLEDFWDYCDFRSAFPTKKRIPFLNHTSSFSMVSSSFDGTARNPTSIQPPKIGTRAQGPKMRIEK